MGKQVLAKQITELYGEYLKSIDEHNKKVTNHQEVFWYEPSFEGFMVFLNTLQKEKGSKGI